jgi:hypothetical protein
VVEQGFDSQHLKKQKQKHPKAIQLRGIYPRKQKKSVYKKTSAQMFLAALLKVAKTKKNPV